VEDDEKIQAHLLSVWRQTKKLFSFWGVEGMLFLTDKHLMFVNKTEAKMKWWKTIRERQGVTLMKSKNVMIHHDGYKEEDLKKDLENKKNLEVDFDNIFNIDHEEKVWVKIGKQIKVQISTGDFESVDQNLAKGDILVLTNEKMDSIIRHSPEWIDDIGLVVSDEVHLIGDQNRGPTLEMILTKLKLLPTKPQIIALSATITNDDELSEWLGCKSVTNNWRPVPLSEGVYDGGTVTMDDGKLFEVESTIRGPQVDLGAESVKNGGQSLLFAETRTRSAALATKAADVISRYLEETEKNELEKFSQKMKRHKLSQNRELIDTCFKGSTMDNVLGELDKHSDSWSKEVLREIMSRSPTSLKITFEALRKAKTLEFNDCMAMEYRITEQLVLQHDFYEGVRAVIIDKDNKPEWKPSTLDEVNTN